jgi:hypothetical protein
MLGISGIEIMAVLLGTDIGRRASKLLTGPV